tara:strand:+ start:1251 stop:1985 length:735 start_codon:yes stop_codon:yes gene_type:complete
MNNTVIIIPSRLKAKRLPNKPIKLIRGKEMILHVFNLAVKSGAGEVLVTTPDKKISDLINKNNGKSFVSQKIHETGTDRVFEAFENYFSNNPKFIINLQGDMPNLDPKEIIFLSNYLNKGLCDIATLAAPLKTNELEDQNVVKVFTNEAMKKSTFSSASDFHRNTSKGHNNFSYHHIGIYGFTNKALIKYVNLKRSKLELERDLEQMRALENNMKIHVGLVNSIPLSVDTEEDLQEIEKKWRNY